MDAIYIMTSILSMLYLYNINTRVRRLSNL